MEGRSNLTAHVIRWKSIHTGSPFVWGNATDTSLFKKWSRVVVLLDYEDQWDWRRK